MSKLRDYRQQAGYKQSAFVEKLRALPDFKNCTVGALSRWENGDLKLPTHKWAQILAMLGKPYEPLTEIIGEKAAPVSAQSVADGTNNELKALLGEMSMEFNGKVGNRTRSLLGTDQAHRVAFAKALEELAQSGRSVHVPSFERGWNAAVEALPPDILE